MSIHLTVAERLVVRALIEDLLNGNDTTCPLPTDHLHVSNKIVAHYGGLHVDVAVESLTSDQKIYLRKLLELVAGLCLRKAMGLTNEEIDPLIERARQFLQYGDVKL